MNELLLVLRLVGLGLLYLFLTVALYVIWRSFSTPETERASEPDAATLRFDDEPKRRFELRPVTALGRASDNDIVIDDPFTSSNHAMIIWRDGGWWIEDLGSHNGTFVNDVITRKAAELEDGDYIGIGQTCLRFTVENSVKEGRA
jgi:pSer/pThr/pTyr-binding forkhead associated (FHA) protein